MKIDTNLKEDLKNYIQNRMAHDKSIVTVISPYTLSDSEVQTLKNSMPMLKEAVILQEKDAEIIGGVIIKFGSKMIDLSLKSELQKLQQKIYEIA